MDDGRNDEDGCVWLLLLNCDDSMGLLLNGDCIDDCMLVLWLLVTILLLKDGCCIIEGCCGGIRNWPDDGGLNGRCCDIC